jgi:hypothetical protein
MSVLSFIFEGVVAALMVALIVYCVRLDRRLAALRENDAPIRALIEELRAAADRAEASVGRLKAAGLDAERSLQQAIRTAQAVEDDLVRRARIPAAAAPAPRPAAAEMTASAVAQPAPPATTRPAAARDAAPAATARAAARAPVPAAPPLPASPATRSEAERDLLRAIRFARAEGEA